MTARTDLPSTRRRRRLLGVVGTVLLAGLVAAGCGTEDRVEKSSTAAETSGGTPSEGIWLSKAEIASLPTSGPGWESVQEMAGQLSAPDLSNQDDDGDLAALASALVYARTGDVSARAGAARSILQAIGTEDGGRTLALARNLASVVIAADLIDLRSLDGPGDASFRAWLESVRDEDLDGMTLRETYEKRPNNWGTHAGASLSAAAAYLGEQDELDQLATVFRGWVGDRAAYDGFDYDDDLSWQADPEAPVGINAAGTSKDGHRLDGALPEELRRGCSFTWAPCETGYTWEALQGAVVNAQILSRQGFDTWGWQQEALRRAVDFHEQLDREVGGWWAESEDAWILPLVNSAYGTRYSTPDGMGEGKNMAFTEWTHA